MTSTPLPEQGGFNERLAVVVYYLVIVFSYLWAGAQLAAGELFDCLVLFTVTFMFQSYRNGNRRLHGTK